MKICPLKGPIPEGEGSRVLGLWFTLARQKPPNNPPPSPYEGPKRASICKVLEQGGDQPPD